MLRVYNKRIRHFSRIERTAKTQATIDYYYKQLKIQKISSPFSVGKDTLQLTFQMQKKLNKIVEKKKKLIIKIRMKKKQRVRTLFKNITKRNKKLLYNYVSIKKKTSLINTTLIKIFNISFWKNIQRLPGYISRAIRKGKNKQKRALSYGYYFNVLRKILPKFKQLKSSKNKSIINRLKYFPIYENDLIFQREIVRYNREKKIDLHLLCQNLLNYKYTKNDPYYKRKEKELRYQKQYFSFSKLYFGYGKKKRQLKSPGEYLIKKK